jgi:small subunit ribosomal protein S20
MRQASRRRIRNRAQRSAVRSAIKQVRDATGREAAEKALQGAQQLLDRAARKGLIKANAAARHKRRLAKVAKTRG